MGYYETNTFMLKYGFFDGMFFLIGYPDFNQRITVYFVKNDCAI